MTTCPKYGVLATLVTSFGTDSAVLIDLVSKINPSTPVIFIDTGMHFRETLVYAKELECNFRLKDLRVIQPLKKDIERFDSNCLFYRDDPDACCKIRKVEPLQRALAEFDAWITGRKRFQTGERLHLPTLELDAHGHFKVNPLVNWSIKMVDDRFESEGLQRHPLWHDGFTSIGCRTCTQIPIGEHMRSGRWAGKEKTVCGIHRSSVLSEEIIEAIISARNSLEAMIQASSTNLTGIHEKTDALNRLIHSLNLQDN